MRQKDLIIDRGQLSGDDVRALLIWSGFTARIADDGDVAIRIRSKAEFRSLQIFLEVLGHGRAPREKQ